MPEHAYATELLALDALIPTEGNPNSGDIDAIALAIAVDGWHGQVMAAAPTKRRKRARIFAGETRWRALKLLNAEGITLDGELRSYADLLASDVLLPPAGKVPAQLLPLADLRALRKLVADNESARKGHTDEQKLADLLQRLDAEDDGLVGSLYGADDLTSLLSKLDTARDLAGRATATDEAPPVPVEPITQPGDVWVLGSHRLICGDSRDPGTFVRLLGEERADMVWTDPPYGMNLETDFGAMHTLTPDPGQHAKGNYAPVIGDDAPFDARPFLDLLDDVKEQFWFGADYYRSTIKDGGSWIVWDKRWDENMAARMDAALGAQFELCWTRQSHRREIARVLWSGHHGLQREDTKTRVHPTQKPIALAAWFFDRWGAQGDLVVDPFAGSGTTLMACEQEGRKARCIEIDSGYCDVIVERWEKMTGQKAERIAAVPV